MLFAALDHLPQVERGEDISMTAVDQARQFFLSNDPRYLHAGAAGELTIPVGLMDESANYAAAHFLKAKGALQITGDHLTLRVSKQVCTPPLPWLPCTLNVRADLYPVAAGQWDITGVSVGDLPIPHPVVVYALNELVHRSKTLSAHRKAFDLAQAAIQRITVVPERQVMVLNYVWNPAILAHLRAFAAPPDDVARMEAAQAQLVELLKPYVTGAQVPLTDVLIPMMTVAAGDPWAQRRMALLVLALYAANRTPADYIPQASNWPMPRAVALTLNHRHDSAQHFVISATISAWAGEPVADAIGLYKEQEDARLSSGFSFADLTADRAGAYFGELLARQAPRLDALLRHPVTEADLVPSQEGLPPDLPELAFRHQFGGPGTVAYQRVSTEIERRLAALPLYRTLH